VKHDASSKPKPKDMGLTSAISLSAPKHALKSLNHIQVNSPKILRSSRPLLRPMEIEMTEYLTVQLVTRVATGSL
jgi:hypothetical protein